ncbi:hypothetical protein [Salipaludibacillus agaradhaerens]|uniref:hypothetical protein n=1 Tax=Salipaludibacillus agaradhaerens TaxID=76935 RepID=UPI000998AA9C|nr:hypothetical protein [Salipaludibacillus agaradhaerens]
MNGFPGEMNAVVISSIVSLTIALGIYIFYDLLLHPKKSLKRRLVFYLFLSYLVVLLDSYFLVIHIPPVGVEWMDPQLKPFRFLEMIIYFLNYTSIEVAQFVIKYVCMIAFNFIPLGIFLGWYFNMMRWSKVLVLSVSIAFIMGCVRHLLSCLGIVAIGVFDVDYITINWKPCWLWCLSSR